jgi:hypothetical protein
VHDGAIFESDWPRATLPEHLFARLVQGGNQGGHVAFLYRTAGANSIRAR